MGSKSNNFASDVAMFYCAKAIPMNNYYAVRLAFPRESTETMPDLEFFCKQPNPDIVAVTTQDIINKTEVTRKDPLAPSALGFFTGEMRAMNKKRMPNSFRSRAALEKDLSQYALTEKANTRFFKSRSFVFLKTIDSIYYAKIDLFVDDGSELGTVETFFLTDKFTESSKHWPLNLFDLRNEPSMWFLTPVYSEKKEFLQFQVPILQFLTDKIKIYALIAGQEDLYYAVPWWINADSLKIVEEKTHRSFVTDNSPLLPQDRWCKTVRYDKAKITGRLLSLPANRESSSSVEVSSLDSSVDLVAEAVDHCEEEEDQPSPSKRMRIDLAELPSVPQGEAAVPVEEMEDLTLSVQWQVELPPSFSSEPYQSDFLLSSSDSFGAGMDVPRSPSFSP
jgi:hypothetical protein